MKFFPLIKRPFLLFSMCVQNKSSSKLFLKLFLSSQKLYLNSLMVIFRLIVCVTKSYNLTNSEPVKLWAKANDFLKKKIIGINNPF